MVKLTLQLHDLQKQYLLRGLKAEQRIRRYIIQPLFVTN